MTSRLTSYTTLYYNEPGTESKGRLFRGGLAYYGFSMPYWFRNLFLRVGVRSPDYSYPFFLNRTKIKFFSQSADVTRNTFSESGRPASSSNWTYISLFEARGTFPNTNS